MLLRIACSAFTTLESRRLKRDKSTGLQCFQSSAGRATARISSPYTDMDVAQKGGIATAGHCRDGCRGSALRTALDSPLTPDTGSHSFPSHITQCFPSTRTSPCSPYSLSLSVGSEAAGKGKHAWEQSVRSRPGYWPKVALKHGKRHKNVAFLSLRGNRPSPAIENALPRYAECLSLGYPHECAEKEGQQHPRGPFFLDMP